MIENLNTEVLHKLGSWTELSNDNVIESNKDTEMNQLE